MNKPTLLAALAALGTCVVGVGVAAAIPPPPAIPPNGPHGCALSDVAGQSAPVVHDSDTSHIGGNFCTYTQVASDASLPPGGSYFAAAQSWSIVSQKYSCVTVTVKHRQHKSCGWVSDPAASFSSAAGSPNVGQFVIPVGDKATVKVSNGTIVTGTFDGAPGS